MSVERYKVNWFPQIQTSQLENVSKDSLGVSSTVVDLNKYMFSISRRLGEIHFNSQDLEYFQTQIDGCMDDLKSDKLLHCPYCDIVANEAVMFSSDCNCQNLQFVCQSCWKSECPECKVQVNETPTRFHAVDVIRHSFTAFTIQTVFFEDGEKKLKAIAQLLRSIELEIMCNFCNSYLKNATLVKVNFPAFPEQESVQCCGDECAAEYQRSYGNHGNSIRLERFDGACAHILKLLNTLLGYCEEKYGGELGPKSSPLEQECMKMYHGHTALEEN